MDTVQQAPITMCRDPMTFAEGTGSTINTTGTNIYIIQSLFKSRTALSNQATPTTDLATGNAFIPMPVPGTTTGLPPGVINVPAAGGYACAFGLGFNAAGDLLAIQGPIVGIDVNGTFIQGAPSLQPSLGPPGPNPGTIAGIQADANFCLCGVIVVKSFATATATFTFGTTSWTTTGYTTALLDLAGLPGRSLANLTYS
jgi:hypothetical protein